MAVCAALGASAAAGLGTVGAEQASAAGATAAKTSCTKLQREVKRADTATERRNAKRAVKRCKDGNTANAKVLAKVRNGHYVGTRADGQQEDWTLCASGAYVLRSTSDGSTGVSTGKSWRIADATLRKSTAFTAVVEDPAKGTSVGLALTGGTWQVGVSRSFGELEGLGPATRTDATAECAAL